MWTDVSKIKFKLEKVFAIIFCMCEVLYQKKFDNSEGTLRVCEKYLKKVLIGCTLALSSSSAQVFFGIRVSSRSMLKDSLPCAWLPSQTSSALPLFPTVLTHPYGQHLPPTAPSQERLRFFAALREERSSCRRLRLHSPWPPQGPDAGRSHRSKVTPGPASSAAAAVPVSEMSWDIAGRPAPVGHGVGRSTCSPTSQWSGGGGSRYPGGRAQRQQIRVNNTAAHWRDRCDFIYQHSWFAQWSSIIITII